jgi:hypothetical protein
MDIKAHNFRPNSPSKAKVFNLRDYSRMQAINKAHLQWATHHMAHKPLIQMLTNKELQVDIGSRVGLDIRISHRMVVRPTSISEFGEVSYNVCQAETLGLDETSSRNRIGCLGTGQDCYLRLLEFLSGISILLTMNVPFSMNFTGSIELCFMHRKDITSRSLKHTSRASRMRPVPRCEGERQMLGTISSTIFITDKTRQSHMMINLTVRA